MTSQDATFANRIALVTGASRGLGRAIALALSDAGAHVIACARRRSALEDLDDEIHDRGGTATLLQLDLTVGDKVDAIGPTLFERYQRLDVFVGNAAILGTLSPTNHVKSDDWDRVIATNLTANWRLIRTLDPLLRASEAGRALFVTAEQARETPAYWAAYAASKSGLEGLVKTYAAEVQNSTVRANLLMPSPMRTDLRKQAYPGENPLLPTPPAEVAALAMRALEPTMTDNGRTFVFPNDASR
ncbi:MAG: SDR family oxidoreductase [Pseudomonadota bacterium]